MGREGNPLKGMFSSQLPLFPLERARKRHNLCTFEFSHPRWRELWYLLIKLLESGWVLISRNFPVEMWVAK